MLAQTAPAVSVAASQTFYCVASIALPILGPNAKVLLDLDFVLSGANAKTVYVYLSPTVGTVGTVTAPTGSAVTLQSAAGGGPISLRMLTGFQNLNSVSSQEGGNDNSYIPWSQSFTASRTSAINTGAVSYINVYVSTGAADTALLKTLSCVGQDPLGL